MSGPIKKGDLVMVARGQLCCGGTGASTGKIFRVSRLTRANLQCAHCASFKPGVFAVISAAGAYDIARLKKIDPPATGEYDRVPVRKTQPRKVPV